MVGKAKSISHTSSAVDYARLKDHAKELCRSDTVMGKTGEEITREFKVYQNLNQNCKKNTLTIVLSPAPKDGQKLTQQDFKELTQDYLKKMNLTNHQYIAYTHADRNHKHIHLFVNRIDNQGTAYKDSYIGKKSQNIANEIAQERGLIQAKEVELSKQNNYKELRNQIYSKHQETLKENPKNFQEYRFKMEQKGVEIHPIINNKENLQGFRVEADGKSFKASEVHRSMSYNKLKLTFEKEYTLGIEKEKLQVLKDHRLVLKHNPKNFAEYQQSMRNKGYHISNLLDKGGKQGKGFILIAGKQVIQGKVKVSKEEYKNMQAEMSQMQNIHIQLHLDYIEKKHEETNEQSKIQQQEAKSLANKKEIGY